MIKEIDLAILDDLPLEESNIVQLYRCKTRNTVSLCCDMHKENSLLPLIGETEFPVFDKVFLLMVFETGASFGHSNYLYKRKRYYKEEENAWSFNRQLGAYPSIDWMTIKENLGRQQVRLSAGSLGVFSWNVTSLFVDFALCRALQVEQNRWEYTNIASNHPVDIDDPFNLGSSWCM